MAVTPAPTAPLRCVRLDRCPVCGGRDFAFAFASVDLLHDVPGLFAYERCRSCLSYVQNPRVHDDDLWRCYPGDYFTHGAAAGRLASSTGRVQSLVRRLVLRSRAGGRGRSGSALERGCGLVLQRVPPIRRRASFGLVDEVRPPTDVDRCLELGPGTGDDMWRLSQLGWDVTGLDLDPQAAEAAAAKSGCRVVVGSILEHRPPAPYGLIYGSHSIEHVPDMAQTIVHLRSLLGPGGRLVLIVPNARSISARLYGAQSVVWDPPRHLSLPSIDALRGLLAGAGFVDVTIRSSAARAAHYGAIARARRGGATGTGAWEVPLSGRDRLLQAGEAVLVGLGVEVGEEIVVSATAGCAQR